VHRARGRVKDDLAHHEEVADGLGEMEAEERGGVDNQVGVSLEDIVSCCCVSVRRVVFSSFCGNCEMSWTKSGFRRCSQTEVNLYISSCFYLTKCP
jgi:hypothetical protein